MAPSGRSRYVTCRVAVEHDDEMVADLQAYRRLLCRRRALIEIGDDKLAVHFEGAGEVAIFSGPVDDVGGRPARFRPHAARPRSAELPNGLGEEAMTLRTKACSLRT